MWLKTRDGTLINMHHVQSVRRRYDKTSPTGAMLFEVIADTGPQDDECVYIDGNLTKEAAQGVIDGIATLLQKHPEYDVVSIKETSHVEG